MLPACRTGAGSATSDTAPLPVPAATRSPPTQATALTCCGWGTRAVSDRVARFHTSTFPSAVPAASDLPSGLNATALSPAPAPLRVPAATALTGFFLAAGRSVHSQTRRSALAAARVAPSGLKATPDTGPAGPVKGMCAYSTGVGDPATRHSTAVPADVPAASTPPVLNATVLTGAPALSGLPSGAGLARLATFHSRTLAVRGARRRARGGRS